MNTLLINASKFSALGVFLCGSLIGGQAFAAWGNDSPWSKKHAELKKQAAEEVVIDTPVIETPVVEPVAVAEPEPVVLEPVAMPVETVIESESYIEEVAQDDSIWSVPSDHFAVQVYASSSTDNMDRYKVNNGLEDLTSIKTDRNGQPIYVLISLHEDRSSANEAAENLELIVGSKPWVRSVGSLQAVVAE